jgi:hypothetical protein
MEEFAGYLGYVEIRSTDRRMPRVVIRLRLHHARHVFKILKNLWEEDQIKVGAIARLQT